MQITLTVARLKELGACSEAVESVRAIYGDEAVIEWTAEKQIETLKGPISKYVGWAYARGLVPLWSMASADLRSADLRSANLRSADLSGARICSCPGAPCAAVRELLASAGWTIGPDGLLARTTQEAPCSP